MHFDLRYLEPNSEIEGDICIIGAGAAGISLALELEKSSIKVILLESGGFEYDEQIQSLYRGTLSGQNYYPLMSSRLHYFGGTTMHWGGMCSPLDDIDFEKREWVDKSGWPINKNDLDEYYTKAQEILDLGPNEYNLPYWQKLYPDFTPLAFDKEAIWNKMWQFSSPTRMGTKYKESIINSKNIFLYTYATVTELISTGSLNSINKITIKDADGKESIVKSKIFVLACGAVENARTLLASNNQFAFGVGNEHGHVGRYFMEHLEINAGELWLYENSPLTLYQRVGKRPRAELSISAEKQKELEILNITASLVPLEIQNQLVPNMVSWSKEDPRRSLDAFGKDNSVSIKRNILRRFFTNDFPKAYSLYSRSEQSPNELSRVTLLNEKDRLGVPKINLNWALSPIDKKTFRLFMKMIGQQAGKNNIGRVRLKKFLLDENDTSMPSYTSGGWHQMGTTRMSENPKNGVVDKNCKVHSLNNLYVAGASCFPTVGSANPTLTIVALTMRLADHLKKVIENKQL